MTVTRVKRDATHVAGRLMQAVGFVFYLLAVQALMTAAVGISVFWSDRSASDLVLPGISLVLMGTYAAVGYHLRRLRLWARNFAFAFGAISLLAFPFGTGLGIFVMAAVGYASRVGVFPKLRRPAPEDAMVLRFESFEPELVPERAL
jgi:hypothetical protein